MTGPAVRMVLFDGACGFCAWSVATLDRCVGTHGFTFVPYQLVPGRMLAAIGVTRRECASAVHVWDGETNRLYRGADAINYVVGRTRVGRNAVAILERFGPIVMLERKIYALVASRRSAISRVLGTAKYAPIADGESTSG